MTPKRAKDAEFDARVLDAIQDNDASRAEDAAEGKGTSAQFAFARSLKAMVEFRGLDGLAAAQKLDQVFLRTFPQAKDLHPFNAAARAWEEAFPELFDARLEFIDTFEAVRIPGGELFDTVLKAAQARPLIPKRLYSEKYLYIVSIAGHLQKMRGELPIMLPVGLLARKTQCDQATVSRIRKRMIRDGLIVKTKDYDPHKQNSADEFLFDVSLFDFNSGLQVSEPRVAPTQSPTGCKPATPTRRVARVQTRLNRVLQDDSGKNRKEQERENAPRSITADKQQFKSNPASPVESEVLASIAKEMPTAVTSFPLTDEQFAERMRELKRQAQLVTACGVTQ